MDYFLINKYFQGDATEEEIREIFEWMNAAPENRKELIQYKKIWALTANANENQQQVWKDEFVGKIKKKGNHLKFYKLARYAAAFLILLGLGAFLQYVISGKSNQELTYLAETRIVVPAGQMSKVELPDGSTVQLNSGSTLLYSANYNSGERTVSLEGEAFFDVAKDQSHPFVVQTKVLDFKVYGTSFNIQAYSEDDETNATLVEGSIGVSMKNGKELTKLSPGDNARYINNSKVLDVEKVNLDLYTSWKDGLITFKNESLKDIALKIERWYNVEIIIQNEKLANEKYMGTIMRSKPVDQILEVFRLTSTLKYRIEQRSDKPTLIYWE